ncbi:MAG: hypothetical protein UY92_C0004G0084 [Candidatus Magasanikbacteria bacterium GW2011_GWA2_56_11]|uniref:Glycosyltransferase RgtA/B/C/D-like domain-containing protein n=1 Tax=Candidatus Magasanikbacteria bacterium GW2011_GWA2_56_11 TaxID=1619044 RepID=A0A0G1YH45_9BACT|nr:MAG: hypothetical protein UY92_C0004G0084 [Candidatus Magasanikbacteria bacterium GW2011_GWA2_56_11]
MRPANRPYPLLLIVLFAVQFFFVSPAGEFALNDDWVHAEMIRHWVETGELKMNPFTGPTLHWLILLGALAAKIGGFSFTLLRLTTLAFTLALILLTYYFLHRVTRRQDLAFIGALLVWLNPIAYNLSFTYMTDIPALCLLTGSLFAYHRAFSGDGARWLCVGSLAAVLGFYTRQTNLMILAAAGIAALLWYQNRFSRRQILFGFGLPLAIWAAVYLWLAAKNLLPAGGSLHFISGIRPALSHGAWWIWYLLIYSGLFFLPLILGAITARPRDKKLPALAAGTVMLALAVMIFIRTERLFPYAPNMIHAFGLGPMAGVLRGDFVPLFTDFARLTLTAAGALGAGWLVQFLSARRATPPALRFVWLSLALLSAPILLFQSFDRYLLPLLSLLAALVLYRLREQQFRPLGYVALGAVLALYAVFSLSQTAFYLAWNETRWRLADSVLSAGTPAAMIDGGYEWDGWHSYWEAQASGRKKGPVGSPWWIRYLIVNNTEEYVVSASPLESYTVLRAESVPGWNPNRRLYLLQRRQDDNTQAKP